MTLLTGSPSARAITAHKCALLSFLLNLLPAALQPPSPINRLVANLICSIRTAAHRVPWWMDTVSAGSTRQPPAAEPGMEKVGHVQSDTTQIPSACPERPDKHC